MDLISVRFYVILVMIELQEDLMKRRTIKITTIAGNHPNIEHFYTV